MTIRDRTLLALLVIMIALIIVEFVLCFVYIICTIL